MNFFKKKFIGHLSVRFICGSILRLRAFTDAIVGGFLLDAVAKRGTGPVVYHPSNLGFRYPYVDHTT